MIPFFWGKLMKFNYVVTATPVGNESVTISESVCRSVEAADKEEFMEILRGGNQLKIKRRIPKTPNLNCGK